jgi:hypothetical protein
VYNRPSEPSSTESKVRKCPAGLKPTQQVVLASLSSLPAVTGRAPLLDRVTPFGAAPPASAKLL